MEIKFERNIAKCEYALSEWAAIPVLGIIPATIKVILGIIQTSGALLCLIIATPFLWHENGRKFACRAGSHFFNGWANIIAGSLEAVPILGAIIFVLREYEKHEGSDTVDAIPYSGQEHMLFVGYRILQDNPSCDDLAMLEEMRNSGKNFSAYYSSPLIIA